jgi:hypothetical protein
MEKVENTGVQIPEVEIEVDDYVFDAVEIVGLILPLVFAILAIIMVAFSSDSSLANAEHPPKKLEPAEQIIRR